MFNIYPPFSRHAKRWLSLLPFLIFQAYCPSASFATPSPADLEDTVYGYQYIEQHPEQMRLQYSEKVILNLCTHSPVEMTQMNNVPGLWVILSSGFRSGFWPTSSSLHCTRIMTPDKAGAAYLKANRPFIIDLEHSSIQLKNEPPIPLSDLTPLHLDDALPVYLPDEAQAAFFERKARAYGEAGLLMSNSAYPGATTSNGTLLIDSARNKHHMGDMPPPHYLDFAAHFLTDAWMDGMIKERCPNDLPIRDLASSYIANMFYLTFIYQLSKGQLSQKQIRKAEQLLKCFYP